MDDATALARHAAMHLDLAAATVPPGYAQLPLCLIDAVFSLGMRYTTTRTVVRNYIGWAQDLGAPVVDVGRDDAAADARHTIGDIRMLLGDRTGDVLADEVFHNHNRTSSRSGILKSEAVRRLVGVLAAHGVDTRTDLITQAHDSGLKAAWRAVPGQRSGVSWRYLLLLAGHDQVKPDRMIVRFVQTALDRPVGAEEAARLLTAAHILLRDDHPDLRLAGLDHAAWQHARR